MPVDYEQALPGISRALRSLGGNPYEQGRQAQIAYESAIAQAMAKIEQERANTAKLQAEADAKRVDVERDRARPQLLTQRMAAQSGMTVPEFSDQVGRFNVGMPSQVEDDPAAGQTKITQWKFSPEFRRAMVENLPIQMADKVDPNNVATASRAYRDMNQRDDVQAGLLDPMKVAQANAAAAGRDPNFTDSESKGPEAIQISKMLENPSLSPAMRKNLEGRLKVLQTSPQQFMPIQWIPTQGPDGQTQTVPMPTRIAPGQTLPDPIKPPSKTLPAGAIKMQQEMLDQVASSNSIENQLTRAQQQLQSGQLSLSPTGNLIGGGLNAMGMSTANSRNLASFRSTLEKLRNDSLRLNSGVQTEGDAQRAWNELVSNINDQKLVEQRLAEIIEINRRGAQLKRAQIDLLRNQYGVEPLPDADFARATGAVSAQQAPAAPSTATRPAKTAAPGSAPVTVRNDADYDALPSGALFVSPDGVTRRKP